MHPLTIHRRAKGLTLVQLAAQVGASYQAAQAWEKGTMPRPKMFLSLAQILEVDPAELQREMNSWKEPATALGVDPAALMAREES